MKTHSIKSSIISGIIIVIAFGGLTAQAANFIVSNTNDDELTGSLRHAIVQANSNADSSNTIEVNILGDGPFEVQLQSRLPAITKTVTLDGMNQGDDQQKLIVEGSEFPEQNASSTDCLTYLEDTGETNFGHGPATLPMLSVQGPSANGTVIKNMVFRNSIANAALLREEYTHVVDKVPDGTTRGPCEGLKLDNVSNVTAENNHFIGFLLGQAALNVESTSDCRIAGNEFTNNNDNLEMSRTASGNIVENNLIIGTNQYQSEGIALIATGSDNVIRGNQVSNVGVGIFNLGRQNSPGRFVTNENNLIEDAYFAGILLLGRTQYSLINGNIVENSGTGINVARWSGPKQSNIVISSNFVSGSKGPGVHISGDRQVLLSHNYITNNGLGGENRAFNFAEGKSPDQLNEILPGAGGLLIRNEIGRTPLVTLLSNVIYNNNGLGIDLSQVNWNPRSPSDGYDRQAFDLTVYVGDGVTMNDYQDPDNGANNMQNYPVLNYAKEYQGNVRIHGHLNTERYSRYRIDFYASDNADPSSFGEGQRHLAHMEVETNGGGNAVVDTKEEFEITFSTDLVKLGDHVSATATKVVDDTSENDLDRYGETSEFSATVTFTQ